MSTSVRLCCVLVLLTGLGMTSALVGYPLGAVTAATIPQAVEPVRSTPAAHPSPVADLPAAASSREPPASCTSTIAPTTVIDGRQLGELRPGAVVCLAVGQWGKLTIQNVAGTADRRITFRNAGEQVALSMLNVYNSQHLRILGNGSENVAYGLVIEGNGHTVKFRRKTEYLEFAYAEIASSNGIALNAKTQATCPDGTTGDDAWDYTGDGQIDSQDAIGSEYVVHDLHFHHLFVRQAGSEALYVGSNDTTQPARDLRGKCSPAPSNPVIEGIRVADSIVQDFGRDGINIKGAPRGENRVERNTILRGSSLNDPGQNGAIKISQNASVDILDNTIEGNHGTGIGYIGTGGNIIARNEIRNVGGMFDANDEKGSGIWIKPTGDAGPMEVIDNTVEGSTAWGVHVEGDAHVAGNQVRDAGNESLNVNQDSLVPEPRGSIPRGDGPTLDPTPTAPARNEPGDRPVAPALEPLPTAQPSASPPAPLFQDAPATPSTPPAAPLLGPWSVRLCLHLGPKQVCWDVTLTLDAHGQLQVVEE